MSFLSLGKIDSFLKLIIFLILNFTYSKASSYDFCVVACSQSILISLISTLNLFKYKSKNALNNLLCLAFSGKSQVFACIYSGKNKSFFNIFLP